MRYELLIAGGEVVDPAGPAQGRLDVAISGGRIAAVDRDIPPDTAAEVFDAAGLLVMPGLVDLHTHVYRGATFYGIAHDAVAWRTGVTTWVDAGSAGAYTFAGFREFVAEPAATRTLAFLNISAIGLTAPIGELIRLEHVDVDLCKQTVERNRDHIVGVKARISRRPAGDNGLAALALAQRAATACEVPLMVHIGHGPPELDEVLHLLKPRDIVTHCCVGSSMRLLDDDGRVRESVWRAREAGILFDVGHGSSSFSFAIAEALAEHGFWPDVISTDLHQRNIFGPVFDLPHCMAKFLELGMPMDDVVRATTAAPAAAIGLEEASLRPGRQADIAVFEPKQGSAPLFDSGLELRWGGKAFLNRLTLVRGRPLAPVQLPPPPPWVNLTDAQQVFVATRDDRLRLAAEATFGSPDELTPGPSLPVPDRSA